MRRIYPDSAAITIAEAVEQIDTQARDRVGDERPYLITNFAQTIDGRATIGGVSGQIGSDTDTRMLIELRSIADAVMIGAGTMRTERYGRMLPDQALRDARERRGLSADPLAVIVSNSLDLPWDSGLFESGSGEVVLVTSSTDQIPKLATPVRIIRSDGAVDLSQAMAQLRGEGIRLVVCEGGPLLHAQLLAAGLLDEMFVTLAPKVSGEEGPRIIEGYVGPPIDLQLSWLLESDGELFSRWRLGAAP